MLINDEKITLAQSEIFWIFVKHKIGVLRSESFVYQSYVCMLCHACLVKKALYTLYSSFKFDSFLAPRKYREQTCENAMNDTPEGCAVNLCTSS